MVMNTKASATVATLVLTFALVAGTARTLDLDLLNGTCSKRPDWCKGSPMELPGGCYGRWPCPSKFPCLGSSKYDALKAELEVGMANRTMPELIVSSRFVLLSHRFASFASHLSSTPHRRWASSDLFAHVAAILLRELLGFNVTTRAFSSGDAQTYVVSGGKEAHVSFEFWETPASTVASNIDRAERLGLIQTQFLGIFGEQFLLYPNYVKRGDGAAPM